MERKAREEERKKKGDVPGQAGNFPSEICCDRSIFARETINISDGAGAEGELRVG